MKPLLKLSLIWALLTQSLVTFAGPLTCNDTFNLCSGSLSRLNFDGSGNLFITFQGQSAPSVLLPSACGNTTAFTFAVANDNPQINFFYAMALTAQAAGQDLEVTGFSDAGGVLPNFCLISNQSIINN